MRNFGLGRAFGVELEVVAPVNGYDYATRGDCAETLRAAGINAAATGYTHSPMAAWKIVSDASVSGGFEVVSPILNGEEGIAEVALVCRTLTAAGYSVNSTTGLHVHVDARGLGLVSIKRIVKAFIKYEDCFDMLVSPERLRNSYCRSNLGQFGSYQGADEATAVAACLEGFRAVNRARTVQGLARLFGRDRYRKLNLEAIYRHHTVEFRQHEGSLDETAVTSWVRLVVALVMFATAGGCKISPRKAHGHVGTQRLAWLFNNTLQGDVRRYYMRKVAAATRRARRAVAVSA